MPPKRACDVCYRRKIQCSIPAKGPPCDWCSHHGSACSFDRDAPRRTKRTKVTLGDVECLNERIRQLEDALAQANARSAIPEESPGQPTPTVSISGPSTAAPIPPSPTTAASAPHAHTETEHPHPPLIVARTPGHAARCDIVPGPASRALQPGSHIGPNWFFRGIHAFSDEGRRWISSKTGQPLDWTKLRIFTATPSPPVPELCELPGKEACRELVALFLQSTFQLNFPVVDPVLIQETIHLAYGDVDDGIPAVVHRPALACVFAALSVIAFLPGRPFPVNAEFYASKSRFLLNQIPHDVSCTTLQTVVMLHVQCLLDGRWQEAESFLSTACRMVYTLRGHILEEQQSPGTSDPSSSNRETRHVRNLFWLCYLSDKDLSLRTGQPPLLADIYCDLTLPEDYLSSYTYLRVLEEHPRPGDSTHLAGLTPHLWGDAQLGCLKEKVYRLLYSVHATRDDDEDNRLLVHIRRLDDEIERWRLAVPLDFRPALSVSPETLIVTLTRETSGTGTPTPRRKRYFHLLLEYWYLMIFVHTTVRRYDAHTVVGDGGRDLHSVIHSSYDLSLEAGRSTLRCLRVFTKTLSDEHLWFLIFYATNAAISLFLNIVIHPGEVDGQLDLELLISAANTLRAMKPRGAVPDEGARIQQHSDFIMWLVWLGSCAITKEREGSRPS